MSTSNRTVLYIIIAAVSAAIGSTTAAVSYLKNESSISPTSTFQARDEMPQPANGVWSLMPSDVQAKFPHCQAVASSSEARAMGVIPPFSEYNHQAWELYCAGVIIVVSERG